MQHFPEFLKMLLKSRDYRRETIARKHTLIIKEFNILLSIQEQIKCTKNKLEIL